MNVSFGPVAHFVRQALHMRQVEKPETEVPGEAAGTVARLLHPFVIKNNPQAAAPPAKPAELRVMSYNVRLGGLDYAGVARDVQGAKADVVCLQEVSRPTAERLARSLGLHLTYYQSVRHNNSLENGKAILSRFPTTEAESIPMKVSVVDRLKGMWAHFQRSEGSVWQRLVGTVSIWQKRSLLRTTMRIGGKPVDVIDVHLTTGNPAVTAKQFAQLSKYVADRKALGHEVIVAGDFNTRDDAGAKAGKDTAAWAALKGQLTDAYGAAPDVRVKGGDGVWRSPAEARAAMAKPGLPAAQREVLRRQAVGVTVASGNGRIDGVLTSGGFDAKAVTIDQQTTASDHLPLVATFTVAP